MDEKIFNIIMSFIPLMGAIITAFVVPYIKGKIDLDKIKDIENWVTRAVDAAEALWPIKGSGETRKDYVVKFMTEYLTEHKVQITDKQLDILIEAAVEQLNIIKHEAAK